MEEDEPMPWPGTLAVVHSYLAHKTGWGNFLRNHHLFKNVFTCKPVCKGLTFLIGKTIRVIIRK